MIREFWDNFTRGLLAGLPTGSDVARFLLQLLRVLVIVILAFIAARWVKRSIGRPLARTRLSGNAIALIANAAFVVILLIGFSWLLGVFGASWTAVLASLSVVTVAISLALQDVLKNFVAGIYLLLEQPFRIGDQVVIKGMSGEVKGIDIRTTILTTEDGLQVIVPNSVVFTEIVTNRSATPARRVVLSLARVSVAFADLARMVNEALHDFEQIERTPAPRVMIQKLDEGNATVTVEYWQRATGSLNDVLAKLQATFPDAEISVTSIEGVKPGVG